MAWDSKESPWQWDTGAVLLQGHGSDPRYRAPARGWASEACFTGHVCSQSGSVSSLSGLGTCVTSLSSASSNLHGALASGIGEQGDFVPPDQRRLPVVTTLKGNESFAFGCNGEDSGKVAQNRGQDNRKRVDESNAGFLELGRRPSNHTQQQGKGSIQPEQRQGRVFLPAGGSAQDTKNGTAAQQTEEQNSSTATGSAGSGDSLIGLHLGKRAYFEDASGGAGTKATQKPPLSSNPAPAKKPRAAAGALHTPRCQVEGCKTDLTSAKDYHRRHKVCEMHSKAVKVIVANQEQRFCQQCSRFHVLAEFDEVKRSCRRRLAGHNERRRKPQPDALAINSRLPSVLQEWPSFFHHPRFSGMSSLWEDPGDFRLVPLKGAWPRTIKLEDQQSYDNIAQAPGMERQLFLTGLPSHTSDKLPLLLLQSPRRMMSVQDDTSSQRVYQYLPGSVGPIGNGLTLSSSPGTGVLSGFEAIPATQAVTRVTDSGRALSLLSALTRGSHAPDTVSLDLSTPTSITVDQFISESQTAAPQQLVQGGQQHHFDYTTGNLLSIASNCRNHSSAVSVPADGMTSMEKDQYAGLFLHGLNGVGSFESNPLFSTLQGNESRGTQDARQTIDLMRNSSESQSACPQGSSVGFELGSSTYGDLQYSYEPSFFDSQQRM